MVGALNVSFEARKKPGRMLLYSRRELATPAKRDRVSSYYKSIRRISKTGSQSIAHSSYDS